MRVLILAASALVASADSHAVELKLLGSSMEFPYEYKVLNRSEAYSRGYGLRSTETVDVQLVGGPFDGQRLQFTSVYYSPDRVDQAFATDTVRKQSEKAASEPGNRSVAQFQSDGFDFHLVDGKLDSAEYPQRMYLAGAVNGAFYSVNVLAGDQSVLTPDLAASMKALRLDHVGMLKARTLFEAEGKAAALENHIETTIGRMMLAQGSRSRLVASSVKRDADGKPIFRKRSFAINKTGFWTQQDVVFSLGCGADDAKGYDAFIRMTAEFKDEDADDRYAKYQLPHPVRFLGMGGEMASADGSKVAPLQRTDVTRMAARQAGTMYLAHVEHFGGGGIAKAVLAELPNLSPVCRLELPFGASPAPVEKPQGAGASSPVALRD